MQTIRFAHISDTHLSADPDAVLYGAEPVACFQRVLEQIAQSTVPLDFLLHTGDVAADPDAAAYDRTAELLPPLALPAFWVAGNHDDPALLANCLPMGPHQRIEAGAPWLTYTFACSGHRFLVLGAVAPPEIEPHGTLGREVLEAAEQALREDGPWTVVVHFPPVPLDCAWIDREMLLTDGEALHRLLCMRRDRVRAVLFGHVHRTMTVMRDGILYASAGSTFSRFNVGPADDTMVYERGAGPEWNLVTLTPDRILIRAMSLPAFPVG